MHYDEIRRYLRAEPFLPFRIRLSNGSTFDVRHPELVVIRRMAVEIGTPSPDWPPYVMADSTLVSMLHIAELVPLPPASATVSGQNGSA